MFFREKRMTNFISRKEIEELSDGMVKGFSQGTTKDPISVDIDSFVKDYLCLTVVYENFAEKDVDKVGYTGDGRSTLKVRRNGIIVEIRFPQKTIVLDKFLLTPSEECLRRYVLAHEAGHFLSNSVNPDNPACFYHSQQSIDENQIYTFRELKERFSIDELNANSFAKALLMPRFIMKNVLRKYNAGRRLPIYGECVFHPREKTILKKMEDTLLVSHSSLVLRLRELDMLKYHSITEYITKELGYGRKI